MIERSDRWIIDHGALLGILLFSPLLPLAGVRWNESISDELFWFDLKTKGREKFVDLLESNPGFLMA